MLVLTRKLGEKIRVGHDIIISIVEIQGGQVRVGVEAPKHVSILREEIYREIEVTNLQAAQISEIPQDLIKKILNDEK